MSTADELYPSLLITVSFPTSKPITIMQDLNDALTIVELEERFETTVAAADAAKGDTTVIVHER
jgi:hypothetical protein